MIRYRKWRVDTQFASKFKVVREIVYRKNTACELFNTIYTHVINHKRV